MYKCQKNIKIEEIKAGQLILLENDPTVYLVVRPRKDKIKFVPLDMKNIKTRLDKKCVIVDVYNSRNGMLEVHKQ